MSTPADIRDYLKEIAHRLDEAAHGEAGSIKADACALLGWAPTKLYRQLKKQVGWVSGRKARSDKGTTKQDIETVKVIAAMERESVRKNGKRTMFSPVAIGIAKHNGYNINVSASRLNKIMKDRRMDVGAQKDANPSVDMRALYPNHVHQVDPSLCLVYYAKGEQHIIEDDEFYKNKMDAFAKVQFKCWRYVLTDRASNWTVVRYYAAAGENTKNLFDFLMYAWKKIDRLPFHGVPDIMVWDKGSANTSATIKNMLDALGVEHIAHTKGNARAKGSVEQGNNRVETQFECRLKYQPVKSVAELNAHVEDWMLVYNGNLDPHQDTRLKRRGVKAVARTDLWLKIREEQLRILPSVEICRSMLEGAKTTRKVKNLKINYKHPQADCSCVYLIDDCPGICDGDTVDVRPMLFGHFAIMLRVERYDGEDLQYKLEPITEYDEFGQRLDAAVFGQNFKAHADTEAGIMGKTLDRVAYPDAATDADIQKARDKKQAPLSGLNTLDYVGGIKTPTYMPKRGIDHPLSATAVPELTLTGMKMMRRIMVVNGQKSLSIEQNQAVKAAYPSGMTEEEIQSWVKQMNAPQKPSLRAVG